MPSQEKSYKNIKDSGNIHDLKYKIPHISVPEFIFNSIVCKNVDFVWMGKTPDKKDIYMSKDCLPEVQVSMDSLLAGSINGDIGTGTIGTAAAASLDSAVFAITNKHLQPYVREYDGKVHTEKIFFPLECEVFGAKHYAADTATLSKYPQWKGFNKSRDSKIKYIDYSSNKDEPWYWWEANKARFSDGFCYVYSYGDPSSRYSYHSYLGVGLAFCL